MEHKDIERINELARLAKERALTDAEKDERLFLRQQYLAEFRQNMQQVLDNVVVKESDGSLHPLEKKKD